MPKFSLQVFCTNWNRKHRVQFHLETSDGNTPTGVMVRYPKRTYGEAVYSFRWFAIISVADTLSSGAMIISSTRNMSRNGILEFNILTSTDGYDPEKIATALKQINSIIDPLTYTSASVAL